MKLSKTAKIVLFSIGGLAVLAGGFFGIRYLLKSKTPEIPPVDEPTKPPALDVVIGGGAQTKDSPLLSLPTHDSLTTAQKLTYYAITANKKIDAVYNAKGERLKFSVIGGTAAQATDIANIASGTLLGYVDKKSYNAAPASRLINFKKVKNARGEILPIYIHIKKEDTKSGEITSSKGGFSDSATFGK